MKSKIEIEYCSQCNWLLRAAWMAQEILSSFSGDISELSLIPGSGGIYEIRVDGKLIFSRKAAGRFPEAKEVKTAIRDLIDPSRSLGHTDAK